MVYYIDLYIGLKTKRLLIVRNPKLILQYYIPKIDNIK